MRNFDADTEKAHDTLARLQENQDIPGEDMRIKPFLKTAATILLLASTSFSFAQQLGHFERIKVLGPSLQGNLSGDDALRDVSVYLPPSYENSPERRYPVIYLLHGYTDSDDRWFGLLGNHFVNVPNAVDDAWRNGAAEMIIVMPNAFTRFAGSMYSNSVVTGDWESYVAKDLVAYIDNHYRTIAERDSRGLAGHSMGGYGTLRIGMKYSEVFAALYAMSPCCMGFNPNPTAQQYAEALAIETDEQFQAASFGGKAGLASAAVWSPNPDNPPFYLDMPVKDGEMQIDVVARWAANAPLVFVHQYIPQLKSFEEIYIDAGDRDVGIAQTVREMSGILGTYGVKHWSEIYGGDHVDGIHARITTHLMPMFSEVLDQE
jgi:S-formylglutathione hydrolase